ncbi:MAG: inositol-3-phosphate synthase, partial [Natronosporangium sp.]
MDETSTRDAGTGRVGVWLVGARGSVATTAVLGAAAIRAGLAPGTGLVSELPDFHGCQLPAVRDLVFGGHDIAAGPLAKRAEALAQQAVVPVALPELLRATLDQVDAEIRPGVPVEGGGRDQPVQAEQAERLRTDLTQFRSRHRLDRVVVVNVSATEPPPDLVPAYARLADLELALARPGPVLPPS